MSRYRGRGRRRDGRSTMPSFSSVAPPARVRLLGERRVRGCALRASSKSPRRRSWTALPPSGLPCALTIEGARPSWSRSRPRPGAPGKSTPTSVLRRVWPRFRLCLASLIFSSGIFWTSWVIFRDDRVTFRFSSVTSLRHLASSIELTGHAGAHLYLIEGQQGSDRSHRDATGSAAVTFCAPEEAT